MFVMRELSPTARNNLNQKETGEEAYRYHHKWRMPNIFQILRLDHALRLRRKI